MTNCASKKSGHAIVEELLRKHGPLTKAEIFEKAGDIVPSAVRTAVSNDMIAVTGNHYSVPLSKLQRLMLTDPWAFLFE